MITGELKNRIDGLVSLMNDEKFIGSRCFFSMHLMMWCNFS